jgi:SAM-dependent methyltransferase
MSTLVKLRRLTCASTVRLGSGEEGLIFRQSFSDMEAFLRLVDQRPDVFADATERAAIARAVRKGVSSVFFGHIAAREVAVVGPEAREHLSARGLNPRQRLLLDELVGFLAAAGISDTDAAIHCHEAITPFALILRGRFPRVVCTEYAADDATLRWLFPIPGEDICKLSFPDHCLHAVVSGDVLEHVPDIDAALREIARVLKPGGRFLGTFPFIYQQQNGVRQASLVKGQIIYHCEPIYHDNPVAPDRGSLVFELPDWTIIGRARRAGFKSATMKFVHDSDHGIVGSHLGNQLRPRGIFVATFDK